MRNRIKGSFEEVREKVEDAVRDHFKPKRTPNPGPEESCWSFVEATFPTHVIATVETDGKCKQYRIPYSFTGDGDAVLGEPERVELSVVVYDEDDEETEPDEDDEALAQRILPALDRIKVATRLVQSSPEVKSDALAPLENGVLGLLDAMAEKGANVRAALGLGEEDQDPLSQPAEYDEEDSDELLGGDGDDGFEHVPSLDGENDDDTPEYEVKDDGRILLDPATVTAQLASLQA